MAAPLDFAAPKLGSGKRFAKLSGTLAARGAHDPDALAAWIGRRKFGSAGMAKLSHGHANPDLGIYLAETATDEQGKTLTCPECGHVGPAGHFGASGASLQSKPGVLRTPAPGTGSVRSGAVTTVKAGGAAHALANPVTWNAVSLASGTLTARRNPVKSPVDVIVARGEDGTAVIRHRQGGATIAEIRKDGASWVATVDGRDLAPHAHQRTALMEAVGTWNRAAAGGLPAASAPLQPAPEQTPLMAEYGIPAIRLATPATGAGAGPRITMAGGTGDDGGTDEDGLTPKGQAIKKKLIAKGFPPARAVTFAKMSQKTKPGAFGKQAAA